MRSLNCIIFIFFHFFLIGQGGWKKTYHLQNSTVSVCRNTIEAPNSNLIMVGLTHTVEGNKGSNQLTLVGTDAFGNVLWRKNYGNYKFEYLDNILSPNGAILQDGNFFYHTLSVRDSNNEYVGALIKFDYNGDTIWQKVYRETYPKDIIPQGITKSVDGGILITGGSQEPGGQACLLIKTDINGNELWRKRIGKAIPNTHDGKSVIQDAVSKKIIVVGYQYIGSSTYWETYSNILILDSVGNKKIQTTFNNGDGGGFEQVIQLKDKNFLTGGGMNANSDLGIHPRCKGTVVKFDIDGNVIWQRTYDTLSLYNGIGFFSEHPNGDIFAVGGLDTMQNYNLPAIVKIKMFRLDKEGNVIWSKYIGSSYNSACSEFPRSMSATKDKGFIFGTWFPYHTTLKPYSIIKVDSTGCDTSEQWCRSVALNVSKFQSTTGWELEFFPNPASDVLKLSVNAPVGTALRLKLSDVSGKEIANYQYEAGAPLVIDTRRYQEGVYSVTLFYAGRAIEIKKLVIVH